MRKYVATISQLVDMNETEMGWLAKHLGHDLQIHKDFYRMQDSTLEMAVVGNLLMAIDEGRAHNFKGRNLRDITLDDFPENREERCGIINDTPCDGASTAEDLDTNCGPSTSTAHLQNNLTFGPPDEGTSNQHGSVSKDIPNIKKKRRKTKAKLWSTAEKTAVWNEFSKKLRNGELLKKDECEGFLEKNKELMKARTWKMVKHYARNMGQKMKKNR